MSSKHMYHVVSCLLVLGAGLLAGCGEPTRHMYSGPERPIEELATIFTRRTYYPYGRGYKADTWVVRVDGKKVVYPGGKHPDQVCILPGEHVIRARWRAFGDWIINDDWIKYVNTEFSFVAEAGEIYYIDSTERDDSRTFELTVGRDGEREKVPIKRMKHKWRWDDDEPY